MAPGKLRGLRLLVADDDDDFVDYLGAVLRLHGAVVEIASSGVEVLERLSSAADFDLILTDQRMPPPTGAQLLAMARTAGYDRPFLIVTAYPDDRFIDSVTRLERAGVISKPLDADDLIATARLMVRRQ